MEAAVVVRGVTHLFADLGYGTNNDAEWLALIAALDVAQSLGVDEFLLLGGPGSKRRVVCVRRRSERFRGPRIWQALRSQN